MSHPYSHRITTTVSSFATVVFFDIQYFTQLLVFLIHSFSFRVFLVIIIGYMFLIT